MARTVLMQHHPRQGPPLALPPVRPFARRLSDNALPLQMQLQPGVAPAEAVILDEMLVEVLDREALIALAIKPLHLFCPIHRNPLARRLAEPAVQEPGFALLLVAPRPPPQRPFAHPQQLRRLFLIASADSQRCRRFKNLAMRTASSASLRRIQNPPKGLGPLQRLGRLRRQRPRARGGDDVGDIILTHGSRPGVRAEIDDRLPRPALGDDRLDELGIETAAGPHNDRAPQRRRAPDPKGLRARRSAGRARRSASPRA